MKTEHITLLLSICLGILQLLLASAAATRVRGLQWNLSSRDQNFPPLEGAPARLHRAFENFKETFPFFLAAIALVELTGHSGQWSQYGAILYLSARTTYVPLYAFNVVGVRSFVWALSMFGIAAILLQMML